MKTKNILVFGGTGLVGKYLVARLLTEGHTVGVVTRNPSGIYSNVSRVRMIKVDLADSGWLHQSGLCLDQYDVIYHLAYSTKYSEEYNHAITVDSVKVLMEGLSRIDDGRQRHFVLVGSMVVFGTVPKDSVVTEDSLRVADSPYAINKLEATRLALTPSVGVVSTVLHPTGVYDETSPRIQSYRSMLAYNYVSSLENLGINNIVHADDLAVALVKCLERPLEKMTQEYIINGESISYQDWFTQLGTTVRRQTWLNLSPFAERVSRGFVRRGLNRVGIGCPLNFFTKKSNPFIRKSLYSSDKASRDFGFKATIPFSKVCERIKSCQLI